MNITDKIKVTIGAQVVELDVAADTSITDLSQDMLEISGKIAWYGRVYAAAKYAADGADDAYRQWRANDIQNQLARDPKKAEWKCKASYEACPNGMMAIVSRKAAHRLVSEIDAALTALKVKADMLRSQGAMARSELSNIGMTTKDNKISAVKAALTGE